MADPNVVVSTRPDFWVWLAPDWSDWQEGDTAPAGKKGWTRVKVRETLYNDGRIVRNVLDAAGAPVSAAGTPATDTAAARPLDVTPQYDKGQQGRFKEAQTASTAAAKNVKSKYPGVFPPGHPLAGQPATVTEYDAGEPDYVAITPSAAQQDEWHTEGRPDGQGGFDNSRPIMVRTVNGQRQTKEPTAKDLEDWNLAQQMTRNPGGQTDAQIAAAAAKPRPQDVAQPGVTQTTDAQGRTVKTTTYQRPDGSTYPVQDVVQAAPPTPDVVNTPSDQMWTVTRKTDGSGGFETVRNPNYIKPSKIMPDPADPTKLINITHDDQGRVIAEPVTGQTAIKPADLPVLQAKYGEIAQGLGALAQELNSRYARGEITEQQKNTAFTAAHQQAQTQVSEINTILDTSKAIWSGELTQRGQTLNETQSRRSYASGLLGNALDTGNSIAKGAAGPGAGKDIVGGMAAILGVGQQLAQGMGGFRESPEIALPAALQQARGVSLPGYNGVGSGEGRVPSGSSPPLATPNSPLAPGANAIGAGSIGAVPAPGGPVVPPEAVREFTPGIGGPPQPLPERNGVPVTSTPALPPQAGVPGQNPMLAAMQSQLQGAQGFGGSPVAAGGGGMYDPTDDMAGMIGDGADPTWAEAVRRAAAEVTQPGYAWQRFTAPTGRYG